MLNELHPIKASISNPAEKVSPEFATSGLLSAQEKSWEAFQKIRPRLKAGMTEVEARNVALETLRELGSTKNWHIPRVRFGPGTWLTFRDPVQAAHCLQEGDPVYMDLGPVWADSKFPIEYEGDVGDTFVFGDNAEASKMIDAAHLLWKEARDLWKTKGASGEAIFAFLKNRAQNLGYELLDNIDGHRLSDYPHVQYSKERLSKVTLPLSESLWILEFQIVHPELKIGAFYEDLLR